MDSVTAARRGCDRGQRQIARNAASGAWIASSDSVSKSATSQMPEVADLARRILRRTTLATVAQSLPTVG